MRTLFVAAVLALSSLTAAPSFGQTSANASVERPSEAEALAFVQAWSPSDLRRAAELSILRKSFIPGLKQNPDAAKMLEAFPALGPAMIDAMTSQIDVFIAEHDARFFPRAAAIVRSGMSRSDALTLTTFYRSELGRKTLTMSGENADGDEVIERALAKKPIDIGVTQRQVMRAGLRTFVGLTEAERSEIAATFDTPAGRNFRKLMPALQKLQTEIAVDPGPKFKAGTEKAMAAAFERVTGARVNKN